MTRISLVSVFLWTLGACKGTPTETDTDPPTELPQSGEVDWLTFVGGPNDADWSHDTQVLADGSIVVVGSFEGPIVAGNGEANETALVNMGGRDAWVGVFEADGQLRWARSVGSAGLDVPLRVAERGDDVLVHTLLGGSIDHGGATLGPGFGILSFAIADGTAGQTLHASGIAPDDFARPGLEVLSDGSVVTSGMFRETLVLNPGQGDEVTLTSEGGWDLWLAHWGSDGSLQNARRFGGTGDEFVGSLARDGDGFLFYGGFSGSMDVGTAAPLAGQGTDGFVLWMDEDFTVTKSFTWGGPGPDSTNLLETTPQGLVLAGVYDFFGSGLPLEIGGHTLDGAGMGDVAVVRLDADDQVTGAWRVASGGFDFPQAVVTTDDGVSIGVSLNIPQGGEPTNEPAFMLEESLGRRGYSGAVVRVPATGDPDWTRFYEYGSVTALAADAEGGLVAAGDYQTGIVFGAGEPNEVAPSSNGDSFDAFLMRLVP